MKPINALIGGIALSALSLALNAHARFDVPLTASDTGDYIISIDTFKDKSNSLSDSLKDKLVNTLTANAGQKTLVVTLTLDQAQTLAQHQAVNFIEPDNYQWFYDQNQTLASGFNLDDEQFDAEFYASRVEILKSLGDQEHQPYGVALVNADKIPEPDFANKTVCIIDSGLQVDHTDFQGLTVKGNHSDYSGFWHVDQVQHGTHVAGTVAAVENGSGVIGVIKNGNVNLYVQKLSNGAPGNVIRTSHTMEAMEVCANQGADVVSMSFGGSRPSFAVNDVIDRLTERGVLFVAAAGNHGRKNPQRVCDRQPTPELKKACENAHKAKHYPASYQNVISVANIDKNKAKSVSSPQNNAIEVAAPGTGVLSTIAKPFDIFSLKVGGVTAPVNHIGNTSTELPDTPFAVAECGEDKCLDGSGKFEGKACLYQFDFRNLNITEPALNCAASGGQMLVMYPPIPNMGPLGGSFGTYFTVPVFSIGYNTAAKLKQDVGLTMDLDSFSSRHNFLSGTSMATPHVSAVAAKIWSLNESCSNRQIRKVLQYSAGDLGEQGKDELFGYGLVDAQAAHQYISQNGCDVPKSACPDSWYWNQAYVAGDTTTFDGQIYKAKWWSKGTTPVEDPAPWSHLGACNTR